MVNDFHSALVTQPSLRVGSYTTMVALVADATLLSSGGIMPGRLAAALRPGGHGVPRHGQ